MKIHRVVQMLGATTSTGKLASDMYDIGKKHYYSEAHGQNIPVSEMDFQHMVRAFVKLTEQEGNAKELKQSLDSSHRAYKMGFERNGRHIEKIKELELENQRLVQQLEHDETVVPKEAYEVMWDNCEKLKKQVEYYKKLAEDNFISSVNDSETSLQGCYYTFSEVPQDAEGNAFIKNCRKYLNRDSYKIRVKGQHLKPELYGKGRAYHGANMEDSTHMRVYIDTKKGE